MLKIKLYLEDTVNELLHKVSWPSWSELQNSAIVVAIASLIIAIIIYFMDTFVNNVMQFLYSIF